MSPKMPVPTQIGSVADRTFTITWSDGHRSTYSWQTLRLHCPCARCKGEPGYTPRPALTDVPPTIRALRVERVGAYALRFTWMDGHDTGIYPFPLLRYDLCECDECRRARASANPHRRDLEA